LPPLLPGRLSQHLERGGPDDSKEEAVSMMSGAAEVSCGAGAEATSEARNRRSAGVVKVAS
jgi:hypothetical protein